MEIHLSDHAKLVMELKAVHRMMKVLYKLDILDIEPNDFLMMASTSYRDPLKAYMKLYGGNSP